MSIQYEMAFPCSGISSQLPSWGNLLADQEADWKLYRGLTYIALVIYILTLAANPHPSGFCNVLYRCCLWLVARGRISNESEPRDGCQQCF